MDTKRERSDGNQTSSSGTRFTRNSLAQNHKPKTPTGHSSTKEPDLDRMMDYDMQLLQMTDSVTTAIQGLKDSVDNGHAQEAKGKISDAMKAVDALETAYNGRKDVILGVQQ